MLSGGATFGKFHFGLLKALYDYDLMPRTMCGSSIGSLVSAAICSKPYEEMAVSLVKFNFFRVCLILTIFLQSQFSVI